MSRWRCAECGGILGQHFNGCPETPDNDGDEIENDEEKTNEGDDDDE